MTWIRGVSFVLTLYILKAPNYVPIFFFGLGFPVLVFPGFRFKILDFSTETNAGELPVNTEKSRGK